MDADARADGARRVGDDERQQVVDALSRSCGEGRITLDEFSDRVGDVFASRTRGELDAVVADLPPAAGVLPVTATGALPVASATSVPAPTSSAVALPPKSRRRWAVAIMGGEERRGRWRVGRRTTALAIMGGVELDLREALLEGPEVVITCIAVMGGIEVIVPEGIPVEFGGFMLMGGRENAVRDVEPLPGAPRIRINGWGTMGGVSVTSKPLSGGQARRPHGHSHGHGHGASRPAPPPPPPPAIGAPPAPVNVLPVPGGTTTVVFTDICGSTALAERLGDRRWLEVLRNHDELVRAQLERHGGVEVKHHGDGFMAAFGSPRRALAAAADVQRSIAGWRSDHPEVPLRVRIGAHTGEVMGEGNDLFGRHVNVAARIAERAGAGEVLASSLTVELAAGGDEEVDDGEDVDLRGVGRPVRVHRVAW